MNNIQLLSLLRTFLQMAGTFVVTHGMLGAQSGQWWELISGVVLMVVPTIWSMYAHTDTANFARIAEMSAPQKTVAFTGIPDKTKIEAVTALPDVARVIVKKTASDGVGAAAADPAQPKVVKQ